MPSVLPGCFFFYFKFVYSLSEQSDGQGGDGQV